MSRQAGQEERGHAAGPGGADDLLRRWMAANAALFESALSGSVWTRAELLFQSWARFLEGLAEAHAARHGGPGASPFDPAGWLRAEGQGGMADLLRWLEGPSFADLGAEFRAGLAGTREWLAYLAAVEQMKAVLGEAWISAFRRCLEETAEAGGGGASELQERWEAITGEALVALHRSQGYIAAARDLVAAETALRTGIRTRVEGMAEALGLPTRRELDDLHASVHALRRELRGLRQGAETGRGSRRR